MVAVNIPVWCHKWKWWSQRMAPVLPGAPENYPEPVTHSSSQRQQTTGRLATAWECQTFKLAFRLMQENWNESHRRCGFTSQREMAKRDGYNHSFNVGELINSKMKKKKKIHKEPLCNPNPKKGKKNLTPISWTSKKKCLTMSRFSYFSFESQVLFDINYIDYINYNDVHVEEGTEDQTYKRTSTDSCNYFL